MEHFWIRLTLKVSFVATLCLLQISSSWGQENLSSQPEHPLENQSEKQAEKQAEKHSERQLEEPPGKEGEKKESLTRGQKTLLLNAGAMGTVFVYGLVKWDYGKQSFHTENEGWFERDTMYGGADKLGHFWSSYALSHLISYAYRKWGYAESEANLYGGLSNLGIQTFMEIADGFSSQGFSYEDFLMNILGTGVAYIWGKVPNLARKIDFRMEYTPEFDHNDFSFSTNYESQRFLIAVKADGFDVIKNPYLRYLEFHVGYYARGFNHLHEGGLGDRRRHLYVGLGFNVSKLAQEFLDTKVFNYVQIPYTSVRKSVLSD